MSRNRPIEYLSSKIRELKLSYFTDDHPSDSDLGYDYDSWHFQKMNSGHTVFTPSVEEENPEDEEFIVVAEEVLEQPEP